MTQPDIQFDGHGRLRHFLTIEGLKRDTILQILDLAESFITVGEREIKKVPLLRGQTVVNLFFESSTRTRTTFEIAAKRLSADVINIATNVSAAANKGESLLDTVRNLEAMHTDLFVVRHHNSGAAYLIANHVPSHVHIINAGDGRHAHPTQAMLDMFTIRRHKGEFHNLRVAIVGDVLHSRVARSQIHALTTLGVAEVRVIAPKTLLPLGVEKLGVHAFTDMRAGLQDVDVVIMLRLQQERMRGALRDWMVEVCDTGLLPEGEVLSRAGDDAPYTFAHDAKKFPVETLFDAADLASRPSPEQFDELLANRTHPESGVRFWAANGFLIRAAADEGRQEAVNAARSMLVDPSAYVRCLANETLARFGSERDRVPAIHALLELANADRHNLFEAMMAFNSLDWSQPRKDEIGSGLTGMPTSDKRVGERYQSYLPRLVERIESILRP